jgi:hypothetical protein
MSWEKDGGGESTVSGLYVLEVKSLFSIVLLRFGPGSREAFHSHAFNCWSWVLGWKCLQEEHMDGSINLLPASRLQRWLGFGTYRNTFHKVSSWGTTWVLSFRGPWSPYWKEYLELESRGRTLTHGRREPCDR